MHVVLGLEHYGNDFLSSQTQIHFEVISVAAKQLRSLYVGRIVLIVIIVVLKKSDGPRQRCARNENRTNPVMDETFRDGNCATPIESFEALSYNLAFAQALTISIAKLLRYTVDPEKA